MNAVDHDLLADYVGGALEGTPEESRVAQLIADDPAWRAAADELRAALPLVSAGLAALAAAPEPMPADLAARFDALLASPEFAPVPSAAPRPGVGERTLDRDRAGRSTRRGWRRWATPVAVAVGALAVAGVVLPFSPLSLSLSQEDAAGTLADAPAMVREQGEGQAQSLGRVPVNASGSNYRRQDLTDGDRTAAAEGAPEITPFTKATDSTLLAAPGELTELTGSPETLARCLDAVAATVPGTVTSVDFARFEGSPALVISVDASTGGWWFVAGPRCGENGSDELFRAPRN